MSFSYSGDPSTTQKDEIRFLIGDTDKDDPLLLDAEITYLLANAGGVKSAAAEACRAISAKFSRFADEKVGEVSVSCKQKAEAYAKRAKELANEAAISGETDWYAAGISKSDKHIDEGDSDRVDPSFTRDMHENPRKGYLNPNDIKDY